MSDLERILRRYDFRYPPEAVANRPASPRDNARLLVHDRATGRTAFARFRDLPKFLPPGAVLVLNETKVLPARIEMRKETGGKARLLYVSAERGRWKVMADRRLAVGSTLTAAKARFRVAGQDEKYYFLRPSFPIAGTPAFLERNGEAPLPPYIKNSPLGRRELKARYQTVFARRRGSVAAPTASLHFTRRLLRRLRAAGVAVKFVTLHVNLGTFAPLTERNLKEGRLHAETYEIAPATARFLNAAKRSGRPIVAVGTTVVRTLESAAVGPELSCLRGRTDIFIREGHRFRFVDRLITNFHVPRSSLLMLVSAFTGRGRVLRLYRQAIGRGFKLFSFGDSMLIC